MDLGLAGRVAVVTGRLAGHRQATALLCSVPRGRGLRWTYHREHERALAVVAEIEKGGGGAVAAQLDLASPGSVCRAVGAALERWGQVDVLVNNAVYWGDRAPWDVPLFEELAAEEWRACFRVNLPRGLQRRAGGAAFDEVPGVWPDRQRLLGVAADGFPGTAPTARPRPRCMA